MAVANVPDIVVGRLPLYLRALSELANEGIEVTSSQDLGERLGISSAQIRKDLSQFGEFGKQGTGYTVGFLSDQLKEILQVDRLWDVVLVGAGHLGTAVANYAGFVNRGFQIVAVYDSDPAKIGGMAGPFTIRGLEHLSSDVEANGYQVAMLAVPASAAQEVADLLVDSGIQAILCYAPTSLSVPAEVRVQYIDPGLHLQRMTYYIT